jgi:hypothetical protein
VNLEPWQERLIEEYEQLEERVEKLKSFLAKMGTTNPDPLLWIQLKIMESYLEVLNQRSVGWY